MANITPAQVYHEVLALGGTALQAQVGAALVDGIESNGDPTILAGGRGPAAGLFQFEPGTWRGNGGGAYAPVAQDASWQDQVRVFVNASKGNNFGAWGPDLSANAGDPNSASNPDYGYSGAPQPGSAVYDKIQSFGPNGVPTGGGMSQQEAQALQSAVAEGGGAYLSAMNAAQQPEGANPASGASAVGSPGDQRANGSAFSQIEATLTQYGLGSLANWAWGELVNGKNSDQIMIDLQQQPAYQDSLFGTVNTVRAINGLKPMAPSDILTYADTAYQLAQQAGIPKNFMGQNELTQLMGNDVSASELSDRVTKGYMAAMNSPAETKMLLHQYFGLEPGAIAAYYLNPKVAEGTLQNQTVAAEVGTQAQQSGFGALSAKDAMNLSQVLQSQGKIGPTTGKWDVDTSAQFAQIAPLVPLTESHPGTGKPIVTTSDLLNDAFTGTVKPNIAQAEQVEGAGFHGGGGGEVTAKGAAGAGFASDEGVGSAE